MTKVWCRVRALQSVSTEITENPTKVKLAEIKTVNIPLIIDYFRKKLS